MLDATAGQTDDPRNKQAERPAITAEEVFNALQEENKHLHQRMHQLERRVRKIERPFTEYFEREVTDRLTDGPKEFAADCTLSQLEQLRGRLEKRNHF